ncbi:putative T7SS-secreted protein [Streptomyces fildesensis]|uniref:T7SS-secreted protein n=1 Tax=Streptomyces fildesensis TaxID=375757 RepID=A0ABW8C2V9_9ACTN
MARPTDWHPLADLDPVPGDVHAIRDESTRLGKLATTIQDQVARLRAIGSDTSKLKGQYADELRSKSRDLAGKLAKTHDRYSEVSGHLKSWSDDLDGCQSQSVTALHSAQDAQRRIDAHRPPEHPATAPGTAPPPQPTPEEQAADAARGAALHRAIEDLDAARQKLHQATGHRDERAKHWRGQIEKAIDDGVHDSTWDKFKDFVDKHSRLLNDLANALSWIATGLAVLALFIPGVNIIAFLALAFTVGTLLTHVGLALAGDGNWFDVGLDLLAIATFGVGRLAAPGLKAAEGGVRAALEGGAERFGAAAWKSLAKGEWAGKLSAAGRSFATKASTAAEKALAKTDMSEAMKALWAGKKLAISDAFKLAKADLPQMNAWKTYLSGGTGPLRQFFTQAAARFPGESSIANEIAKAGSGLKITQAAFHLGFNADIWDKGVGMTLPWTVGSNPYSDFKSWCTKPVGSAW